MQGDKKNKHKENSDIIENFSIIDIKELSFFWETASDKAAFALVFPSLIEKPIRPSRV
jgi:hypothetical protein